MCVCKFRHAYNTSSAIEVVEKFLLHFFPTINGTRLKVCVPIKSIALKGADKLLYEVVVVCPHIVARFNEVCHILLWTSLTVELLKFWRLITSTHFQAINPYSLWPCICQGRFPSNRALLFNRLHDDLLDLVDRNRSVRGNLDLFSMFHLL